ncbi:hypothetical protein WDZ17_15080 [Pseudokineococcus basanitobsidens]|uniref:TFIIS-type domain-containing protein n=1 Tax=Pseudokineococcus basanitobsidens TaxID=1926649 RepID=A0ABU8RNH1_9ACTN
MPSTRVASVPRQRTRRPAPAVPLGSLTQVAPSEVAGCPSCEAPRVTRLAMTLTDGTPAVFTSCSRCDHRGWEAEGSLLSIDDVLARTRRPV